MIHPYALILAIIALIASVRTASDMATITITTQATELSFGNRANVHVVVKNSGKSMEQGRSFAWFLLSKHKDDEKRCIKEDCFVASDGRELAEAIKAGKSLETDIDLTELYWKDAILSGKDFSKPKNLFTDVPAGEYYLSFEFYNNVDTTKLSPQNIIIRSNKIPVRINSR